MFSLEVEESRRHHEAENKKASPFGKAFLFSVGAARFELTTPSPPVGQVQDQEKPLAATPQDPAGSVASGAPSQENMGQPRGNVDAVEVALKKDIRERLEAEEWAAVAQLARELEARRNAHLAPNVVELRPPKKDTGR